MKTAIEKIPRCVSLTRAAIWLIQGLTRLIIVFHRELNNPPGTGAATLS
jgi:hypothetical protein